MIETYFQRKPNPQIQDALKSSRKGYDVKRHDCQRCHKIRRETCRAADFAIALSAVQVIDLKSRVIHSRRIVDGAVPAELLQAFLTNVLDVRLHFAEAAVQDRAADAGRPIRIYGAIAYRG